ncbi:MAG: sigma-70 family RNA polymerase sigma factor [Rudaea sp.]
MPQPNPAVAPIDFLVLAEQRPYLMRIARIELREEAAAEDMVSDVLTQAFERREQFRGGSSLRTWLVSILKHRIIDLLRKQWREQPLEIESDDDGQTIERVFDGPGHYIEMPTAINDPAELSQQDDFLSAVQACVDRLPKRIGQVFVLREVFGSDTKELCKELGLTASNVWVQLYRARMMLRMCLERGGFGRPVAEAT